MKLRKFAVILMILTICIGIISGCGEKEPFKGLVLYENPVGISIYMEEGFTETEVEGVLACYQGEISNVRFGKDTFESLSEYGFDSTMTEKEYAEMIIEVYQLDSEVKTDKYGNVYIDYNENISGNDITYYAFFDKGTEAFWMTTFMCMTEYAKEIEDDFMLWASSITIK